MCEILNSIINNHNTKENKNILTFIAKKLGILHYSQWSSDKLKQSIEETNINNNDLIKLLETNYNVNYLVSSYNKYTVNQLRQFLAKSNIDKIRLKSMKKKEIIEYIVDNNISNIEKNNFELSDLALNIKKMKKNKLRMIANKFNIKQYKDGKNITIDILSQNIEKYMLDNNIVLDDLNTLVQTLEKEKIEKITIKNTIQNVIEHENKIQYVIHLADIHIPQKDRYQEYIQVFKTFINQIDKQEFHSKTIVVICGDIFHKKVYQKANAIILWNYLVKEITKLYPLFVITGNHDYDMTTNDNDWISSTFNTKNFYHLNKCGEYAINNIRLGISPLNSGNIYKMEQSDKIGIQLYHGAIKGSKLYNGNKINEGISMDCFGDYDYLLLGDIHKMQFLSDNVGYSGSMIQQNFGESVDNHGFIIWDIKNKTKQFYEIYNPYAFIIVKINNNGYSFNKSLIDKKFISVRYDLEINDISLIDKFKEFALENGIEIIKSSINKLYNISTKQGENVKLQGGHKINVIDYFNKKAENDKLSEDIKKNLCELHEEIQRNVETKDRLVSEWKIISIDFQNLFCFGNNHINTLDLNQHGIYKLFANNFMGKSSILKVVKWALFQESSGINDFDVLHRSSKIQSGFVHIKFQSLHSNKEYILERNITKDEKLKSMIRIEHKISYVNKDNTEIIGKDNVNNELKQLLGTYEEFELVSSVNNTDLGILHKNASTVFNQLFNLQNFTKYEEIIKVMISEAKTNIKLIQNDMKNIELMTESKINDLDEKINNIKKELDTLHITNLDELIELKQNVFNNYKSIELIQENPCDMCNESLIEINMDQLKEMQMKKEDLRSAIRNVKIQNDQVIIKNINRYNLEKQELEIKIKKFYKNQEQLQEMINNYNQQMSNIKYDEIELYSLIKNQKLDYYKTKQIIIEKLNNKQITINDYDAIRFLITEHNYHDMMTQLEQNKIIKIKIHDLDNQLKDNNKKMAEAMERYNEITHKRYSLEIMLKENNANKIIHDKNIKLEKEIEEITHNLIEMCEIEKQNKTIIDKRKMYEQYQNAIEHNNKYKKRKQQLEEQLDNYEKILSKKVEENQQIIKLRTQKEKELELLIIEKDKGIINNKKHSELKYKLHNLISSLDLYLFYKNFVHESGIPNMILYDKLPIIQQDVNDILFGYTNFKILIEFTGKRKSIEIYQVKNNNERISLNSLSGYETLMTNIAFKIAIKKNCILHCSNLIMIDEVLSSVSQENYDLLPELFLLLESYYDTIFLITHIQDIKELCENNGINIELEKDNNVSKVRETKNSYTR